MFLSLLLLTYFFYLLYERVYLLPTLWSGMLIVSYLGLSLDCLNKLCFGVMGR